MTGDKKVALALSGGGSKGAFQAGVLVRMDELGWDFDAVAGVSVGALNGAMVAAGKYRDLQRIWHTVTEADVLRRRSIGQLAWRFIKWKLGVGKPVHSFYDTTPLAGLIARNIMPSELQVPVRIGRVDINTGLYSNRLNLDDVGEFHKILLASASIPVLYPPVQTRRSRRLVDGGIRNITPLGDLLEFEPDMIVIITTEPFSDVSHNDASDIIGYGEAALGILLNEIFVEDIKSLSRINELVRQAQLAGVSLEKSDGSPYKYYQTHLIAPQKGLGSAQDFDRMRLDDRFSYGYERAGEFFNNPKPWKWNDNP